MNTETKTETIPLPENDRDPVVILYPPYVKKADDKEITALGIDVFARDKVQGVEHEVGDLVTVTDQATKNMAILECIEAHEGSPLKVRIQGAPYARTVRWENDTSECWKLLRPLGVLTLGVEFDYGPEEPSRTNNLSEEKLTGGFYMAADAESVIQLNLSTRVVKCGLALLPDGPEDGGRIIHGAAELVAKSNAYRKFFDMNVGFVFTYFVEERLDEDEVKVIESRLASENVG